MKAGYSPTQKAKLANYYKTALLHDVLPFWLKHGLDRQYGGFITSLDRDGAIVDTDKSTWFQGRGAWMFATLYNTVAKRPAWLNAAGRTISFMRSHCFDPNGKMYFTVTREGFPLRMRRYVFSECFAAIAFAAWAKATGETEAVSDAIRTFETFLRFNREQGLIQSKTDPAVRPMKGLSPLMMTIATAQEVRVNVGDFEVYGASCSTWIDRAVEEITRDFLKPRQKALMECVGPKGELIDHFDGRILNPGHSIEAAWFILHEARLRNDTSMKKLGLTILDWMWERGWDKKFGGIYYFRDLKGLPVQEYWQDMKFWWPHNEAIIATLLAYEMTGDRKYAEWHQMVHRWAFKHFTDPKYGEWYGYLHRDGTVSTTLKGSLWKGPFHLPRMLWYCWKLLEESL
ncbi:MAG: AGE family epimerase/isomerase [bacterium]